MPERSRAASSQNAEPPDQAAALLPADGLPADTIARARTGDPEAFRELVERHSRAVFRVAYRITGRVEDAEDVVQETFLKAYRQLDRFEARANLRTWLHRIATNCAVDLLRARPKREIAEEPDTLERAAGAAGVAEGGMPAPERSLLGVQITER